MKKEIINIGFILLACLLYAVTPMINEEEDIIPTVIQVSTYLSPPASSESSGCFLDTVNNLLITWNTNIDIFSKLCEWDSKPDLQIMFGLARIIGKYQSEIYLNNTVTPSDELSKYNATFPEVVATLYKTPLQQEDIHLAWALFNEAWTKISVGYPLFYTEKIMILFKFTVSKIFFELAFKDKTKCAPINTTIIEIFKSVTVDLNEQYAPLTEQAIIDSKVVIEPSWFKYGGWGLSFLFKVEQETMWTPVKILQGFMNNEEVLTYTVSKGVETRWTIGDEALDIKYRPSCGHYIFVLITFEKDCEEYLVSLISRVDNINTRYEAQMKVSARTVERVVISLIRHQIWSPLFFKQFKYSIENEQRILSKYLSVYGNNILQTIDVCDKKDDECWYYSTEFKCQICRLPYVNLNGKCVSKCPDGTIPNDQHRCVRCTQKCWECATDSTCKKCLPGFYLSPNGKCVQVCPPYTWTNEKNECVPCTPGCALCESEKKCKHCEKPAIKYNGQCIYIPCPPGTFTNHITNECVSCINGCKNCITGDWCNECKVGFYKLKGICVQECGDGFMKNELTRTCDQCIVNCKTCSNTAKCETCKHDYVLSTDKTCVNDCELGQVEYNKICIDCKDKPNCQMCNPNNISECYQCTGGKWLQNGKCVDNCDDFYYPANDKTCKKCFGNCKQCTKDKCLQCENGKYILNELECVTNCPPGFIEHGSYCKQCGFNCKKCEINNKDICTVCYDNKILKEGECVSECGDYFFHNTRTNKCEECIGGCVQCKDKFTCDVCGADYYYKDNTCVTDCGEGMKPNDDNICETCWTPFCKNCSSDITKCGECQHGKVLYNNSCLDVCPSYTFLPPGGRTCEACGANCINCTDKEHCNICENSFVLQGNTCWTECNDNYYRNENNKCIPCDNPNCKHCPISPGKCTDCLNGWYLFEYNCVSTCPEGTFLSENNICLSCKSPCLSCIQTESTCTSCIDKIDFVWNEQTQKCENECNDNYTNVNGICKKCEDERCLKCDSNLKCCLETKAPFILDGCDVVDKCPKGKYHDIASNTCKTCFDNCEECDNANTCKTCVAPYFLKNSESCVLDCGDGYNGFFKECAACGPKCSKCKHDNLECCTVCKNNEFLIDCSCVSACPKGYWTDLTTKECKKCNWSNCGVCDDNGNTCAQCWPGFVLHNNKCIELPCPQKTIEIQGVCQSCAVSKCDKCPTLNTCDVCEKDWAWVNHYRCENMCPTGTFAVPFPNDKTTFYCESCLTNCSVCKEGNTCQHCSAGYVLQDGICVKQCNVGYRDDNGICIKCETSNCNACTKEYCTECLDNFYWLEERNICFDQCPQGYYADIITKRCIKCTQFCDKCTSDKKCEVCAPPKVLDLNFKCSDNCPVGAVSINGVCTLCRTESTCAKCKESDWGECVVCTGFYYLKDGKCVTDCGEGYYSENHTCQKCNHNCKRCSLSNICEECNDYYYLLDGICGSTCPTGYYKSNKTCVKCSTNCLNCDSEKCNNCLSGFYLQEGVCVNQCDEGYFWYGHSECRECGKDCIKCSAEDTCSICAVNKVIMNGICKDRCDIGYTPIGNKCVACRDNCDYCNSNNINECLVCKEGYVKHMNTCVLSCPPKFFEFGKECLNCMSHCEQCNDIKTCNYCENGFVYHDGECREKCPSGYREDANRVCVQCRVNNCDTCGQSDSHCDVCKSGFYYYNNECLPKCPPKTYPNESCNCCKDCISGCSSCSSSTTCNTCDPGFYLEKNTCVTKCDKGSVPVGKECKECTTSNCWLCDPADVTKCTQCKDNLIVKYDKTIAQFICVDNCGDSFFNDNGKCESCNNEHCKTCLNKEQCLICLDGYWKQNDVCVETCGKYYTERSGECLPCQGQNCLSCNPLNWSQCTRCELPYKEKNGDCVYNCGEGFYEINNGESIKCKECQDKCSVCSDSTNCNKCKVGFYLKNNECVADCGEGYTSTPDNKCIKCSQENCTVCPSSSIDHCDKCKNGYYLNQNKVCTLHCERGYYASPDGVCLKCADSNCWECSPQDTCLNCDNEMVVYNKRCEIACPSGFYADESKKCKECEVSKCEVCWQSNPKFCKKCENGFKLFNHECVLSCPEGYYSNSNNECQECSANCQMCHNSHTCLQCKDMFYWNDFGMCVDDCGDGYVSNVNGKCDKCFDSYCNKCDRTDWSLCQECKIPMFWFNGHCVSVCPESTFPSGRSCKPCEDSCKQCSDSITCNECYPGKVWHDNDCLIQCPINYTNVNGYCVKCSDSNCASCSSNRNYCIYCLGNYFPDDGICILKCPTGKFYDHDKKKCEFCMSGCWNCDRSNMCNECDFGHYLLNGHCVATCPENYVENFTNKTCDKCDTPCKRCYPGALDYCKECYNNDVLHVFSLHPIKLTCLPSCPELYYLGSNNICTQCECPCNRCIDGHTCLDCMDGYVFHEGQCWTHCPKGKVNRNGVCYSCESERCERCDNNNLSVCNKCFSPYIWFDKTCIETCPPQYHYDHNSNSCLSCPRNCDSCDENGVCTTCKNGFFFYENTRNCQACVLPNILVNNICRSCKVDNCSACKSNIDDECNRCKPGHYLFEGKCYSSCPSGYFKNKTTGTCSQCNKDCEECESWTHCNKCKSDFVKINNECVESCPPFYRNNNGHCERCKHEKCKSCPSDKGICEHCDWIPIYENQCVTECPPGTTLSGDRCTKCQSSCIRCDSTQCFECPENRYIKGDICVGDCGIGYYWSPDKTYCLECTINNCEQCSNSDVCIKCKSGTFWNPQTKKCEITCPSGWFGNPVNNECDKCKVGCGSCLDERTCQQCLDGYSFYLDDCVKQCPSGYTPVNGICVKCTQNDCLKCPINDADNCIQCKNFIYNSQCFSVCPTGTYPFGSQCLECDGNCKACDKDKCWKCKDGFVWENGKCVSKCSKNKVLLHGECVPCKDSNCDECGTDLHSCFKCDEKFIWFNKRCISSCPDGYFHNKITNKCVKCDWGCQRCTADSCEKCAPGYYYFGHTCLEQCPDGYYEECGESTRKCVECDASCKTCTFSSSYDCKECNKGYFLYNDQCITPLQCPEGQFYNNQTCEECQVKFCKKCSDSDTCVRCNHGFTLVNGQCTLSNSITPIIPDYQLVSSYTNKHLRPSEILNISNYKGTGVGSNVVSFSFFIRWLTPKIKEDAVIISIENGIMESYDFRFIISHATNKCNFQIWEGANVSHVLEGPSCVYSDWYEWKHFTVAIVKAQTSFSITLYTVDSEIISVFTTEISSSSHGTILRPTANIIFNTDGNASSIAYHIGKWFVMDYTPNEAQIKALSKLIPSSCDYICDTCLQTCQSCIGGWLPTNNRCNAYYIKYNNGNTVSFTGKELISSLRVDWPRPGLLSDAYGFTTWFKINDVSIASKQYILRTAINEDIQGYEYLAIYISQGYLYVNDIKIDTQITDHTWYFLFISNTVEGFNVIIKGESALNYAQRVQPSYFIRIYDDFIYKYGLNWNGKLFHMKLYINNTPSEEDLNNDYNERNCGSNCKTCDDDLICTHCKEGFVLDNGECWKDQIDINDYTLLTNLIDIWNQKEKSFTLPIRNNKYSINLMFQKKTHSNIYKSYTSYPLLRLSTSDCKKTFTLLEEEFSAEYVSRYIVNKSGSMRAWTHNYNDEVFDFIHVIISVDSVANTITYNIYDFAIKQTINFTAQLPNIDYTQLILGSGTGVEMNTEFSNVRYYDNILTIDQVIELRGYNIKCDSLCKNCDYSNGHCIECYTTLKPGATTCNVGGIGYVHSTVIGYDKFETVSQNQLYLSTVYNVADKWKEGLNAEMYQIYWVHRFYRVQNNAKVRLGCLTNDRKKIFVPKTSNLSKNLICFDVIFKNKVGYLLIVVNDNNGYQPIPLEGLRITPEKYFTGFIGVDTNQKVLKYKFASDFYNMDEVVTGTYRYAITPEKVQPSAAWVLYGLHENINTKEYSLPDLNTEYLLVFLAHGYLESDYDKYRKYYAPRPFPKCSDGCNICSYSEHDNESSTCFECKPGFIRSVNKHKIATCDTISYKFEEFKEKIITTVRNYSIKNTNILKENFGIYFQIERNFYSRDNKNTLIKIGNLRVVVDNELWYLQSSGKKFLIETSNIFNEWNHIYIYFGDVDWTISTISGEWSKTVNYTLRRPEVSDGTITIDPNEGEFYFYGFIISTLPKISNIKDSFAFDYNACELDCALCFNRICQVCSLGFDDNGQCKQGELNLVPVIKTPDSNNRVLSYQPFQAFMQGRYIRVFKWGMKFNLNLNVKDSPLRDDALLTVKNHQNAQSVISLMLNSKAGELTIQWTPATSAPNSEPELVSLSLPATPARTSFFIGISYDNGDWIVYWAEKEGNEVSKTVKLSKPLPPLTYSTSFEFYSKGQLGITGPVIIYDRIYTVDDLDKLAKEDTKIIQSSCLVGSALSCTKCDSGYTLSQGVCVDKTFTSIHWMNSVINNEFGKKRTNNPTTASIQSLSKTDKLHWTFSFRLTSFGTEPTSIYQLTKGKINVLHIKYTASSDTIEFITLSGDAIALTPVFSVVNKYEFVSIECSYSFTSGAVYIGIRNETGSIINSKSITVPKAAWIEATKLTANVSNTHQIMNWLWIQGKQDDKFLESTDYEKMFMRNVKVLKHRFNCRKYISGYCYDINDDSVNLYQRSRNKWFVDFGDASDWILPLTKYQISFNLVTSSFNSNTYTANNNDLLWITNARSDVNLSKGINDNISPDAIDNGLAIALVGNQLIISKALLPWTGGEDNESIKITWTEAAIQNDIYLSLLVDAEANTLDLMIIYDNNSYFYNLNLMSSDVLPILGSDSLVYYHPAIKEINASWNTPRFEEEYERIGKRFDWNCVGQGDTWYCPECAEKFKWFETGCNLERKDNSSGK